MFFDYLEIYNSLTLIMTKMPLEAINTLQNAVVFSGIHAIYHYLQIFGRKTFLLICMHVPNIYELARSCIISMRWKFLARRKERKKRLSLD